MLETSSWIGVVVILLGLVIAGIDFPNYWPQGMFVTGIGIVVSNLKTLITGIEISTSFRNPEKEIFGPPSSATFLGGTARLWGTTKIFTGGIIAYIALREWLFPGWVMVWLKSPLGLAQLLLWGGLIITMTGIVGLLGPVESRKSIIAFLFSPARWFGVILLFIGLAVLGVGLVQFTAPGAIGKWIRELIPPIPALVLPGSIFHITIWR
ncbi:MAG: hypothetical protein Kow0080_01190 [Candidatus Promineifilaceae bacterium]